MTEHKPYIPDDAKVPEFTIAPLLIGVLLGILFGASSLYLVLRVGMTVSASVPIAVLSITLFRAFSNALGVRRTTILENNIVQTAGSAGESIAFGVGVTMPALLLLGFEMSLVRVLTVSVLGGLLGVLLMIPLRRAFIVQQHGKLTYPEGTACAEVLIAGEKGGATASMVFLGFGIAFFHKCLTRITKLWADEPTVELATEAADGKTVGLKGAEVGGELSPELLGVGFLIGPRIACLMTAGAVLSYFVLRPLITSFGVEGKPRADMLKLIGTGAVAAGGIISMCKALPLILRAVLEGIRDLRGGGASGNLRTEHDLPIWIVLVGCVGMIIALMAVPELGLGLTPAGLLGGMMILGFGFLFVTVSSRLTGEIGSSSNPISGMTIATLLLTCLIFVISNRTGPDAMLTVLMIAAVVCIASSNGGTTSQDLKTGYLVGATPSKQQLAILAGALTSATVIGITMLALNSVGSHYTNQVPAAVLTIPEDAPTESPGRPHTDDTTAYRVVHVREDDVPGVTPGRYLTDATGKIVYKTDPPVGRERTVMDDGAKAPAAFTAPQPQMFATMIKGILRGNIAWEPVILGALIAISIELMGVAALPVAVGMYLPITSTMPIFIGGMFRLLSDKRSGTKAAHDSDASPSVLLASGYIAGGTIAGLLIAFLLALFPSSLEAIDISATYSEVWNAGPGPKAVALGLFLMLGVLALMVSRSSKKADES